MSITISDDSFSTDDSSSTETVFNKPRKCLLLGPLPNCEFGPKATTQNDHAHSCTLELEKQLLIWSESPKNVLIIKRIGRDTNSELVNVVQWLIKMKLNVFVEPQLLEDGSVLLEIKEDFPDQIHPYVYKCTPTEKKSSIDFILTLGGDGTLLYAASLFQSSMPPVIAFNLGSMGFLACHNFNDFEPTIKSVLNGDAQLMLRTRLFCQVIKSSTESIAKDLTNLSINQKHYESSDNSFLVLNEVVINRGASQSLSNFDLFMEDRLVTTVQGDGLIISTPTGSTAYAVAAGASMVHPNVPSIMITPICPHSLSFRPIVVPSGVKLKLAVSESARGNVCASFDGQFTVCLDKGDFLTICTCVHPTPCVCKNNPFDDWFESIKQCLFWNSRQIQKSLESVGPSD